MKTNKQGSYFANAQLHDDRFWEDTYLEFPEDAREEMRRSHNISSLRAFADSVETYVTMVRDIKVSQTLEMEGGVEGAGFPFFGGLRR